MAGLPIGVLGGLLRMISWSLGFLLSSFADLLSVDFVYFPSTPCSSATLLIFCRNSLLFCHSFYFPSSLFALHRLSHVFLPSVSFILSLYTKMHKGARGEHNTSICLHLLHGVYSFTAASVLFLHYLHHYCNYYHTSSITLLIAARRVSPTLTTKRFNLSTGLTRDLVLYSTIN